ETDVDDADVVGRANGDDVIKRLNDVADLAEAVVVYDADGDDVGVGCDARVVAVVAGVPLRAVVVALARTPAVAGRDARDHRAVPVLVRAVRAERARRHAR